MNPAIEKVTRAVRSRSEKGRARYLEKCRRMREAYPPRRRLSCGNLAHTYAGCEPGDKKVIARMATAHLGIINAYNDMLSAHQPLAEYPGIIRAAARELGCSAQVAAGVPAMCDGVTQGQAGMELSLFSRDTIAMATAVGLSHNVFDGVLCLGVCDKIVPGMLIGALEFGHLPAGFIPAGPMPSGLPNREKAAVRQRFAEGKAGREELLKAESASYHSPGTCTFYGTANSNQILMELLGVQLPGASFINPEQPLRRALTVATVGRVVEAETPLGEMITAESLVNAVVALVATGGSTNHTIHLVAMARAAGLELLWEDFEAVSRATPLVARVYPNGQADINAFQAAGGTAFLVGELRSAGFLNENVANLMGRGLAAYTKKPVLDGERAVWREADGASADLEVLRPVADAFDKEGGLRLVQGNLGRGFVKISAVAPEHRLVKAPCRIFTRQEDFSGAFDRGELNRDVVAVLRFQGPRANGMPELHQLSPRLGILQDKGHKVALVTDGRMSGASGKVPAVIHLSPEALRGGGLAKLRDGDVVELDAGKGLLRAAVSPAEWEGREQAPVPELDGDSVGRHLFAHMRRKAGSAEAGASIFHD